MPYGSLHIENPRKFDEFPRGDEEIGQALDFLRLRAGQPLPRPPVHDWPHITDCVPRGAGYALDASTHGFHASIRFDPTATDLGQYEIRFHAQQPEPGSVLEIIRVEDAELWRHEYRSLRSFPMRCREPGESVAVAIRASRAPGR
jgi:hypothetical protein